MNRLLKTALKFVVITALLASPSLALAGAPSEIWISIGEDAATQMTVSFTLEELRNDAVIEYGITSPDAFSVPVEVQETVGDPIGYAYHTLLDGLRADTTYQYRVRVGSDASDTFQFHTGPTDPCERFSFIAMGDNRSQIGGSAFGNTFLQAAAATGADFMVNTGDLVEDGESTPGWAEYLLEITGIGREVPIMPVIGNHDDGPGDGNDQHLTKLFHTPDNGLNGVHSHYTFEYGNAFFAVLTNHDGDPQAQADWLDAKLQMTAATWKFVFIHEPFFTCPGLFGLLGHEADEKGVAQYYMPVFAAHHVDMVFTGHNHMYELFSPYNGNDFVQDPANGTIHITTGGAAEAEALAMLIEPALTCDGRMRQSDQIHFLKITIVGGDLVLDYFPRGRSGNAPQPPEMHYGIHKEIGIDCRPQPDGDEPDGDLIDGDETDGDLIDGDEPDGDVIDGDGADGDVPDGDKADGDLPDGDAEPAEQICKPDEVACEGDTIVKCNRIGTSWVVLTDCAPQTCEDAKCVDPAVEDGDEPEPDGDEPDGDEPFDGNWANGGGGCQSTSGAPLVILAVFALLFVVSRRRKLADKR